MQKPVIYSIVVPCYNQEKFLEECLNSILGQVFENWECIIVDDGSTDKSAEVAKKYCLKDNRFKYFYKQNGGLSSTRNFGIQKSIGTYILPLDGDDKIGKEYLQKALHLFELKPKTKLVYCKAQYFGDKNEYWNLPEYSYENILIQNCIFCSAIFKKSDFLLTDGYDLNMKFGYEDWEFWLQLLNKYDSVERLDSIEFFYRQRQDSMINFIKNEKNLDEMKSLIIQKHELKYFEVLDINKNMTGFVKLIVDRKKMNEIKNSISYKTIYKIEREIRRVISKIKNK